MAKTIIEELNLNTPEGRKSFYEKIAAHKEELRNNYKVELPDYETWEKDCIKKMALNAKAIERKNKLNEVKAKYHSLEHKSDRLHGYLFQVEGKDADENNRTLMDKLNKDKKGYANYIAKKILAIDAKAEQEKMKGKSSLELAQMYYENPELYDLAFVVKDLVDQYSDVLDKNLKKKIEERRLDLQALGPVSSSAQSFEDELYAFLPLPTIESIDEMKSDTINFKEFGNSQISNQVLNFFVNGALTSIQSANNKYNAAYEKAVNEKIDDLLSACKASESDSWKDSSKYKEMKKELDAFKKDWRNPDKKNEAKAKLKKAAEDYLKYKADKTMKENSQGKVAAADGILELIDEIDKHKEQDKDDIKPFIKPSNDKKVYEQRATEVYNKAKEQYGKKKEAVSLKSLEEAESGVKKEKKSSKVEKKDSIENTKSKS